MAVHRLLVCGGRDFDDRDLLDATLDAINRKHALEYVIEGEATGADTLAREWAESRGIPVKPVPVDHALDGPWPGAGPRRNSRMLLERPTAAVAFPRANGKWGSGTLDMIKKLKEVDVPVWKIQTVDNGD